MLTEFYQAVVTALESNHINGKLKIVLNYAFNNYYYVLLIADIRKMLRTELSLQSSEFDIYDVGEGTCITFCIKDIRPLLAFAEYMSLPVIIRFSSPGM